MKTLLTLDKNVWNWSQNDVRRTNRIGIYGTILLKKLVKISCNDYEVTKQSEKKIHIQYQFIVPLSLSLHFEVFVGEFNSPSNK